MPNMVSRSFRDRPSKSPLKGFLLFVLFVYFPDMPRIEPRQRGGSGVSLNLAKRKNKISSEIQNLSAVLVRRAWRVQCDPPPLPPRQKKTTYQQVSYWPKQR